MDRTPLLLTALVLGACAGSEGDDSGGSTVDTPKAVDMLLVLDSSRSMSMNNASIAFGIDDFMSKAVDAGVDLQVSVTVAQMDNMLHGELFLGPTLAADGADTYQKRILCEVGCFDQFTIAQDEAYQCGDDPGGLISAQYMDCLCGDRWRVANCPKPPREFLEVVFIAYCRAQDPMPAQCTLGSSRLSLDDLNTNPGMMREGAQPWVVAITDDGDSSESIGLESSDTGAYEKLYAEAAPGLVYNVMGPPYIGGTGNIPCYDGGAESWNIKRLKNIVEATNGLWGDISFRDGNECSDGDPLLYLDSVLATMPKAL